MGRDEDSVLNMRNPRPGSFGDRRGGGIPALPVRGSGGKAVQGAGVRPVTSGL